MVHFWMEGMRRQLGWNHHTVAIEGRRVAVEVQVLLCGLEVAEAQRQLTLSNRGRRMVGRQASVDIESVVRVMVNKRRRPSVLGGAI